MKEDFVMDLSPRESMNVLRPDVYFDLRCGRFVESGVEEFNALGDAVAWCRVTERELKLFLSTIVSATPGGPNDRRRWILRRDFPEPGRFARLVLFPRNQYYFLGH